MKALIELKKGKIYGTPVFCTYQKEITDISDQINQIQQDRFYRNKKPLTAIEENAYQKWRSELLIANESMRTSSGSNTPLRIPPQESINRTLQDVKSFNYMMEGGRRPDMNGVSSFSLDDYQKPSVNNNAKPRA